AEFIIKPKKAQFELKAEAEFKDPYNKDFARKYALPLKIITPKDLGEESNTLKLAILILITAGAGYYWYKKRK
ncbi:LPXTG cell wall anchor domain-containing protein, partial [Candidatus Woesearchaeota archaeon]